MVVYRKTYEVAKSEALLGGKRYGPRRPVSLDRQVHIKSDGSGAPYLPETVAPSVLS